ncbi:UNVERIFIED_CONTAM: hypothetical protein O8I53_07725 [Campylobacter lari]
MSSVFLQGPNLFAISQTKALDLATARFANFLTSKDKVDLPSGYNRDGTPQNNTQKETPFEHIMRIASYVVPTEGFATNPILTNIANKNSYFKVTLEAFKDAATEDSTLKLYEEPASVYADLFRNSIKTSFNSVTEIIGTGGTPTFKDTLIKNLKETVNKFA